MIRAPFVYLTPCSPSGQVIKVKQSKQRQFFFFRKFTNIGETLYIVKMFTLE